MSVSQKQDEFTTSLFCSECKGMTTTITGLKQLFSKIGYIHSYASIVVGSTQNCPFCTLLHQLALLRIDEVPNPVSISCSFVVDGSSEFDRLIYRESSCSNEEFEKLYRNLPQRAFRPGMIITFQGHTFAPDYCASLDINALPGICLLIFDIEAYSVSVS